MSCDINRSLLSLTSQITRPLDTINLATHPLLWMLQPIYHLQQRHPALVLLQPLLSHNLTTHPLDTLAFISLCITHSNVTPPWYFCSVDGAGNYCRSYQTNHIPTQSTYSTITTPFHYTNISNPPSPLTTRSHHDEPGLRLDRLSRPPPLSPLSRSLPKSPSPPPTYPHSHHNKDYVWID